MRYSVPVELSDLVDTLMNVHSREEVMNAFLAIDQAQADLDFSIKLIERLVKSVGEEIQTDEFACLESSIVVKMDLPVPGLPEGSITIPTAVKVEALVEALALQPPAWLLTLMHSAIEIREEAAREKSARLAKLACSCGHNAGVHNTKDGVCSSDQKRRQDCHGCAVGFSGTPCENCGHGRDRHSKNQGCLVTVHVDEDLYTETCDCTEWHPEIDPRRYDCYAPSDCMGPPCGCPKGAHE